MATVQENGSDLLKAVRQLGSAEFDAFLEQALLFRPETKRATLSAKESKLITHLHRGLPVEVSNRYSQLRRKSRALPIIEHAELLKLTDEIESQDAERAAALLELAKTPQNALRILMNEMGIKAVPVHH